MRSFGDEARRGNFGWMKAIGGLRRTSYRERVEMQFWWLITDAHADDETALIGKVDDRAILREMHRVV